jgi:hypothetical protein
MLNKHFLDIIVTERRCGVAEDVLGCTLYKSSRKRMKRHFFGGTSESDQRASKFLDYIFKRCLRKINTKSTKFYKLTKRNFFDFKAKSDTEKLKYWTRKEHF